MTLVTLELQRSLLSDVVASLSAQEADSHELSLRARNDLHSDLAWAQSRLRYYERALELEQTKGEIQELKAETREKDERDGRQRLGAV